MDGLVGRILQAVLRYRYDIITMAVRANLPWESALSESEQTEMPFRFCGR